MVNPETGKISLSKNQKYKDSVSNGLKSSRIRSISSVFDTGKVAILIRAKVLDPSRL